MAPVSSHSRWLTGGSYRTTSLFRLLLVLLLINNKNNNNVNNNNRTELTERPLQLPEAYNLPMPNVAYDNDST